MRAEVLAVGTELLLGQITNSNAAWIGEQLALAGIDCHHHTVVGDNHGRMVAAMRACLARSDAVIVSGGLGPTQDDITREAIAEVMNVALVRDEAIVERVRAMFASRGREMPESNGRQGDVPQKAAIIDQKLGTAPGLICPVGNKVIYAVPGVPYEMEEMVTRAVLPDLRRRAAEAGEEQATIRSRVLRTWGLSESAVAEMVGPRVDALEGTGQVTLAFLASGIEGIKVRISAKAADRDAAVALLDAEETELRALLGSSVFGVDEQGIEDVVGRLLTDRSWSVAVAESVTGGMVASRLVDVPGSGDWFRGAVVAYDSEVKFNVLGVPRGPVVSGEAAEAMAAGVAKLVGTEVGLATSGVAGPDTQEGVEVGTVFVGLYIAGATESVELHLPGDRARVRSLGTISALDVLRRQLQKA
ncbi:MAG TPA: competence/damage-inducible protein A [Acidimicrobiales bacterium]|nr:competence/damage-inducible protein A [Acidimicrobiales bacterium]